MALDNNSAAFVVGVSTRTGIDPRVIVAWLQAEGAYAAGGTGGYNYLNLRPASGDVGVSSVSAGGFDQFSSVGSAITSTVNRINQPFARPIVQNRTGTPAQEIAAIASTGWDAGHYGGAGGPNLLAIFQNIFGKGSQNSSYQGSNTAAAVAATANTGSASSGAVPGPGEAAAGAAAAASSAANALGGAAFKALFGYTPLQVIEMLGGAILILAGVYLLAKQVGLAPDVSLPVPIPVPV